MDGFGNVNNQSNKQTIEQKPMKSFENIVGHEPHKLAISNMLGANQKSQTTLPPIGVLGNRGAGKTTILRAIIEAMRETNENIVILPEPKSDSLDTLPTPSMLRGERGDQSAWRSFEDSLATVIGNDLSTVLVLDEFHELPKGPAITPATYSHLHSLLMQITLFSLESRCGTIQLGENHYVWNPAKHFILVATNYPERVNPALWSRFRKIKLGAFNHDEMVQILMTKLKHFGLRAHEESIAPIVNFCRGDGRELDEAVGELKSVVGNQGKNTINKQDVITAMKGLAKYPFGFCKDFVCLLESLGEQEESLGRLKVYFPSIAGVLQDELAIAKKHKLILSVSRGYALSNKGKEALPKWREAGFSWK